MSNRYLQAADHLDKAIESLSEARELAPGMFSTENYENAVGSLLEAVVLLQEELEEKDYLLRKALNERDLLRGEVEEQAECIEYLEDINDKLMEGGG